LAPKRLRQQVEIEGCLLELIIAIGRHRGSEQFVTMVIRSDWVTNWRAKVVYDPSVLRRIEEATRGRGGGIGA
jgi:hypothetical protein